MIFRPDLCRATERRMNRRVGVYMVRCELPANHSAEQPHELRGLPFLGSPLDPSS